MNISEIVDKVKKDGVCVIPEYWTSDECKQAIDDINAVVLNKKELVSIDKYDADHRIYGFEHLSRFVNAELYNKSDVLKILATLYGVKNITGTLLGQYVNGSVENVGSGVSWHRDSYPPQYKVFIFLTDVTEDSGPFEYYPGTQTMASKAYGFFKKGLRTIRSLDYADDDFRLATIRTGLKPIRLTCKAGTLVVVNTSAVHRGNPLAKRSRYSLTYYAFSKKVPEHIAKISNIAQKHSVCDSELTG